ncbi:hypothetical protein FB559_8358 [Actinoallomurus bryophytorum]|uniref:Uncharacterized protein n=1 Tax=Actinoallomurus bryophytorum TaxID=1490222 RepID=A0A543C1S8_9ACTN|nr:hypothetical protein FB559_8358 [Actinoallomurus bryophytorum]
MSLVVGALRGVRAEGGREPRSPVRSIRRTLARVPTVSPGVSTLRASVRVATASLARSTRRTSARAPTARPRGSTHRRVLVGGAPRGFRAEARVGRPVATGEAKAEARASSARLRGSIPRTLARVATASLRGSTRRTVLVVGGVLRDVRVEGGGAPRSPMRSIRGTWTRVPMVSPGDGIHRPLVRVPTASPVRSIPRTSARAPTAPPRGSTHRRVLVGGAPRGFRAEARVRPPVAAGEAEAEARANSVSLRGSIPRTLARVATASLRGSTRRRMPVVSLVGGAPHGGRDGGGGDPPSPASGLPRGVHRARARYPRSPSSPPPV